MQKQPKSSYIISKLRKHQQRFLQHQLEIINNILKVQPRKENIPDIIKIIDAEYQQKCEKLKADFIKKCYRQPGNELKFDLVYRNQKQQWVQYLDVVEGKGGNTQRNGKLTTAEISKYFQTSLKIAEFEIQVLSQGLLKLLKALDVFEDIQIKKSKQKQDYVKSLLNRGRISESVNLAQNECQVLEKVEENKKQTTFNKKNQVDHLKKRDKQLHLAEIQIVKESQTSQQIKKYQTQIAGLNARTSSLQVQVHRSQEQHQKDTQRWQQQYKKSQEKYNSAQKQINRLKIQITIYQNQKKQLQQQRQDLKTRMSDYKRQLAHLKQKQYYSKEEIRSKLSVINSPSICITGENKQKQLLLALSRQKQEKDKHVVVLQATVAKKQEEAKVYKEIIQQLKMQIKNVLETLNQERKIHLLELQLKPIKDQNKKQSKQLQQRQRLQEAEAKPNQDEDER